MKTILLLAFFFNLLGNPQACANEDPFQISDGMKQFLYSKIEPSKDSLVQLNQLVRIVFQDNALSFTYQPVTRSAIETYNNRGGNCVSFTFLFIAMARHLGIDARFQEVDIPPFWSMTGKLVTMGGHINVAVFMGAQRYIVDLFPRVDKIDIVGRVVSDARAYAHYFNNKGVDQLTHNNYPSAVAYFQKAIEADPSMSSTWINLGVADVLGRQFGEAEKHYKKALELDPKNLAVMSNLGVLYESIGRLDEARIFQKKANKLKLKNPYYHFSLGLQAYQSGEYKKSLDHYKAALRLKHPEHNFYIAAAKSYTKLNMSRRARENIKLAVQCAPDDASRLRYNEKLSLLSSLYHANP